MNNLQKFIIATQNGQGGFLTEKDMPALIALDRLCPVLVRCGGCRFTCGAQDLANLIKCIEAGGDYVRDVSFPVGALEKAANWQPEKTAVGFDRAQLARENDHTPAKLDTLPHAEPRRARAAHDRAMIQEYDTEGDYGGAFDGNQVISDADPGL